MVKILFSTVLTASLIFSMAAPAWSCTTVIVGKDASTGGSVLVSHSVDDNYIELITGGYPAWWLEQVGLGVSNFPSLIN